MTERAPGIFLSYRREDAAGHVGRLFDALVGEFGPGSVFLDVDTLAPGQDFGQTIDHTLDRCSVVLVLIGPRWLSGLESGGRSRLHDPDDYVRIEIERALFSRARVIPVLVGRASMPSGGQLPRSIEGLTRRHALELSDRSWHTDVGVLLTALRSGAVPADATVAPESPPEERKVVSILFCDLVGFTETSEPADPEDVRARLRPYHAKLRQVIARYGGTVENFVGDAVMAVFGAPVVHEDDATRAVWAALSILEALEELNRADARLRLRCRIGINTGEAVVSLGAHPERGEGFVSGEVVNAASRLQRVAPVNGIAVSDSTYRQTDRVFDYVALEAGEGDQPLASWQPVTPRARLGSDVTRTYMTGLVGRELERSLLIDTFERVAKHRSCQLVTLVGEPGVGKSRLCSELGQYVDQRTDLVTWRQGRNLPYGDGIAYWSLGEIVKAECGILESDSPEQASAKLDAALSTDDPERAWLKQRLMPLVGAGGEPATQEESFTAWRLFLEGLAARGPTVLVFEDLHWADNAMLGFLEYLADWSEGVPLLLLCTARPEFQERHPTWAATARNAQKINLGPLSDEETTTLIALLLQRAVLPAATQRTLLDRAGGNPLYAEEFVRLLSDRSLLTTHLKDVPFPDSLQALIAARLDTLSPARKNLLQDASVMGKVFWSGALAAMGGRDARDVEQALHELARKELVRPARTSSMHGEREYGFWHVLVRDVCYAQIPRAARVARHRAAASWIEAKAGERVDDLADVLAHHYSQALEMAQVSGQEREIPLLERESRHYLALAGERALPIDVDSAEASFARALAQTPAGHAERAGLLERWAQAARQQVRLTEAKGALEQAAALYREEGSPLAAARALTALANILAAIGDQHEEEAAMAEALSLLQTVAPGSELVEAYAQMAGAHVRAAAYAEGIADAEAAIHLAAELGLPEPAHALGQVGAARAYLGDQQGVEDMRRALSLAIEQGRARDAAVLHNNLALVTWEYEGPNVALEHCRDGLAFCEHRGIAEVALFIAAMKLTLLAASGRSEEAITDIGAVVDLAEAASDATSLIEARAVQMSLVAERGETAPREAADKLVTLGRDTGEPAMIAIAYSAAVKVMISDGLDSRARRLLEDLDRTSGTRDDPYYAAHLPSLVRRAISLNDVALAGRLAGGIEARTPLQRYAAAASRASLVEAAGNHEQAATAYADAASQWREFGDVPELAYALLGQGRCLAILGKPAAWEVLEAAHEHFRLMGYRPALVETEGLMSNL
jgi:predicted ATPase/class 3 adenylate cyclase